jgi:transcriptional regulator
MYTPKPFVVNDRDRLISFIQENPFGILISGGDRLEATHLPFVIDVRNDEVYLTSHFARANPQWREIAGEVLVVFQGPHAYISPAWYGEDGTVPTWNYIAVHVRGEFEPVENEEEMKRLLAQSIDMFEAKLPDPWSADLNRDIFLPQLRGIKAFRIRVREMQGKWKLNQHHPAERKRRTIEHLRLTDLYNSKEIADWMEKEWDADGTGRDGDQ